MDTHNPTTIMTEDNTEWKMITIKKDYEPEPPEPQPPGEPFHEEVPDPENVIQGKMFTPGTKSWMVASKRL